MKEWEKPEEEVCRITIININKINYRTKSDRSTYIFFWFPDYQAAVINVPYRVCSNLPIKYHWTDSSWWSIFPLSRGGTSSAGIFKYMGLDIYFICNGTPPSKPLKACTHLYNAFLSFLEYTTHPLLAPSLTWITGRYVIFWVPQVPPEIKK